MFKRIAVIALVIFTGTARVFAQTYIENQSSTPQSANFWINGTGTFGQSITIEPTADAFRSLLIKRLSGATTVGAAVANNKTIAQLIFYPDLSNPSVQYYLSVGSNGPNYYDGTKLNTIYHSGNLNAVKVFPSVDWNTITSSSVGTASTNGPIGGGVVMGFHAQHSSGPYAFQIVGRQNQAYIRTQENEAWGSWVKLWHAENSNLSSVDWTARDLTVSQNLKVTGNIGIGSTNPQTKLVVNGNMTVGSSLTSISERPALGPGTGSGEIRGVRNDDNPIWDDGFLRLSAGGGTNKFTKSFIDLSGYMPSSSNDRYMNITMGTAGLERLRINSAGDVSIGTTDAKGYKLAVAGKIVAEEIKVKLQTNWPDYVFASNYQLPTLKETEQHIKEKGHLPGIPSAEEVKNNGVALGEMNAKLLQKIEELTLYIIQQQNEMVELKNEVIQLKEKIK